MPELVHLPSSADAREVCEIVTRDGALILDGVLSPETVARALDELTPYVEHTEPGRDDFEGRRTKRTGALVARSSASREMIVHDAVLPAANRFLEPWCERIQLHLGQVISIAPGEEAQFIHRDRWAWGTHLALDLQPQLNTIWALTDFREENGATQVVPGSVTWDDKRRPTAEEIGYAEMDAGSVLVYSGSVFHGGGENRSVGDRVGVNITYTLGWLRQEENQYLSCPPEVARDLDPVPVAHYLDAGGEGAADRTVPGEPGALDVDHAVEADAHARVAPLVEHVVATRVGAVAAADPRHAPGALAAVAQAPVDLLARVVVRGAAQDVFEGLDHAVAVVGDDLRVHDGGLVDRVGPGGAGSGDDAVLRQRERSPGGKQGEGPHARGELGLHGRLGCVVCSWTKGREGVSTTDMVAAPGRGHQP